MKLTSPRDTSQKQCEINIHLCSQRDDLNNSFESLGSSIGGCNIKMSCRVDQVGQNAWYIDCRDSFITKQDKYRWAEPFLLYRDDRFTHNITASYKLYETVPDYFSGAVLQRHHLTDTNPGVVTLKFQVAFNLAVVWMIVFVSLSKGEFSFQKKGT